jgi:hypothetical protein
MMPSIFSFNKRCWKHSKKVFSQKSPFARHATGLRCGVQNITLAALKTTSVVTKRTRARLVLLLGKVLHAHGASFGKGGHLFVVANCLFLVVGFCFLFGLISGRV